MASKYSNLVLLGNYDGKDITLDISLSINDKKEIKWLYIINWGYREFVRSSIKDIHLKDVMPIVYNDLYKKGIDIHGIKSNTFIRRQLIPYVKSKEYIEWLAKEEPDDIRLITENIIWNT